VVYEYFGRERSIHFFFALCGTLLLAVSIFIGSRIN